MVKPVTVIVKAVLAATAGPSVVTTIRVLVGVATVPRGPAPLMFTMGVPDDAKKSDG